MITNQNDHFIFTDDLQLNQKIKEWFTWDKNLETRNMLQELIDNKDWSRVKNLLMQRLQFGTAGIRGKMNTGFSSMNDLVVIQTSQGLAKYLLEYDSEVKKKGVVIGFDGRHNSKRFAERSSVAFLSQHIPVYLFSDLVPTPFVPFGVKLLNASAGVMITASHNPKYDNGYKVYFSNGAQIKSPHDQNIHKSIINNLEPWAEAWSDDLLSQAVCKLDYVEKAYYENIDAQVYDRAIIKFSDLRITYTALHGVGYRYVKEVFKRCGFKYFFSVKEQEKPDPEFPTIAFPNPEEGESVLQCSIQTAEKHQSTLILANDPDADRCAIAERQPDGQWKIFNGDEIGALLGYWVWFFHQKTDFKTPKKDCYMIASSVSSKILKSMAEKEGFNFVETLTGFKWMGNKADELMQKGKKVLLAYEEAIGYMCGTQILDKDGITAILNLAQLATYLHCVKHFTLAQQLNDMYNNYGYHFNINSYFICRQQTMIKKIFERLSNYNGTKTYPTKLGQFKINRIRDLHFGYDSSTPDHKPALPLSKSSFMLTFYFDNGVTLTIRTSGTEPKIKYYSEIILSPENKNWLIVQNDLKHLINLMIEEFLRPQENHLEFKPV